MMKKERFWTGMLVLCIVMLPWVGVAFACFEKPPECVDYLIERHRGDHRSVADRLKLHVAAVLGAFQFDHDQIRFLVDREQVDAAMRVFPTAKLL